MAIQGQQYLRGQVWYATYPSKPEGSIQAKDRHVLIVSNDIGNRFSKTVIVVPITTKDKTDLPMHVNYWHNNLPQTVLCEQIRTVNIETLNNYVYTLNSEAMSAVDSALLTTLALVYQYPSFDKLEAIIQAIALQKKDLMKTDVVTDDKILQIAEGLEDIFGIKDLKSKDTDNEVKPTQDESVNASSGRKPQGYWTDERMNEYLKDIETMSIINICKKWDIANTRTANNYVYLFKAKLGRDL